MKRIFAVVASVLLAFYFCAVTVFAKEEISNASSQSDISAESMVSQEDSSETEKTVIPQHPNKKYTPIYITVAVLGTGGVVAAAVVVSKKMK